MRYKHDPGPCPVTTLACNTKVAATLASPDCKNALGVYVHVFKFSATAGQQVVAVTGCGGS